MILKSESDPLSQAKIPALLFLFCQPTSNVLWVKLETLPASSLTQKGTVPQNRTTPTGATISVTFLSTTVMLTKSTK